jgi:hypothetical protein
MDKVIRIRKDVFFFCRLRFGRSRFRGHRRIIIGFPADEVLALGSSGNKKNNSTTGSI